MDSTEDCAASGLGVLPSQVVDSADRWAPNGRVRSIGIVGVHQGPRAAAVGRRVAGRSAPQGDS